MKVLHVTNWYPNKFEALEALFIKKQIDALSIYVESEVVHLEVKPSHRWKLHRYSLAANQESIILECKFKVWRVIEWLHFGLLLYVLFKKQVKSFDIINFHIAYPLLVHVKLLKAIVCRKMVITEHWSAYRLNFGIPEHKKSLLRIKRIFHHQLPVITVSKALMLDLKRFSGNAISNSYVVPNVVDDKVFFPSGCYKAPYRFLMVNYWRAIKNPFPVLEAWRRISVEFPGALLVIGGYGPILDEMKGFVTRYNLTNSIQFIGRLSGKEIAEELNQSHALLYSSTYETFSVICAEALSCGTPVVGPFIPAIAEYVTDSNGHFVQENSSEGWVDAIRQFINKDDAGTYNSQQIATDAHARFSKKAVGLKYFKTLGAILNES